MGDKSSIDNFEKLKDALKDIIASEVQDLRNNNDDLRSTVERLEENQQKSLQANAKTVDVKKEKGGDNGNTSAPPVADDKDANIAGKGAKKNDKKSRFVELKKLGDTPVGVMPGVGDDIEELLKKKNITKARQVVWKYILLDEDYKEFKDWLKDEIDAKGQKKAVYDGVKEWCEKNLPP